MVVGCPKCKTKLKVADEKIRPEGIKIKCPKCATVLKVTKPAAPTRPLDKKKIIVGHANPSVIEKIKAVLAKANFEVIVPVDGVDALVNTLKHLPFLMIIDIALPKINGFEIARRVKGRAETKGIKIILISSASDKMRQRKNPPDQYGVDGYVDDNKVDSELLPALYTALGIKKAAPKPAPAPAAPVAPVTAATAAGGPPKDEAIERARRLARTVLSDIELYSPEKVTESIRNNSFEATFSNDLKEGFRHYESRISAEVRSKGNFFQEAIDNFLNNKRKALGL